MVSGNIALQRQGKMILKHINMQRPLKLLFVYVCILLFNERLYNNKQLKYVHKISKSYEISNITVKQLVVYSYHLQLNLIIESHLRKFPYAASFSLSTFFMSNGYIYSNNI